MDALAAQIREEIRRDGPISFARFMELALYAPTLGYYERPREIGRRGDFFTSVSVGSLFGELLAFQFAQWMGRVEGPLQIIEAGGHDGKLAADILGWMDLKRPDIFKRLKYFLVEPSPVRREWQETNLFAWTHRIRAVKDFSEVPTAPSYRLVFSNELLDAMPVHRLAWNASEKKWKEWRVDFSDARFVWRRGELSVEPPAIDTGLAAVLPDGYIVEISPAAVDWWKRAVAQLAEVPGKILTFDYGYTAAELFRPERAAGTSRTYSDHHVGGELLENPGGQDITANVNFPAIAAVGEESGLKTELLETQEKFLTRILAATEKQPETFAVWTSDRIRKFQTLTHPDHLGRAFRVLVQSRDLSGQKGRP